MIVPKHIIHQGKRGKTWKVRGKLQTSGSRKLTWIWETVHEMHSMPQKVKSCDRRNFLPARVFVSSASWHFLGFPVGFTGFSTGIPLACCVSLQLLFLQQCGYGNVSRFSPGEQRQCHAHSGTLTHTLSQTHTHTHTRGDTKTKTETSARKLRSFKSPTFKNWLSGRIGIMTLRCPNFQLYILNSNRSGFWIAIEVIAATSRPRQHWPGLVSVSGFSCWPHDSEAKRRLKSASWRTRCYIREVLRLNPPSAEWWVSQRTSHQDFGLRAIELLPVTVNGYFSCAEAARMQQFSVSQPEFDYPSKIRENLCFKWTKMELMLTK